MDFKKQYIIQAISVASNNLRLSSDKIETVAILREHFEKCEKLESEIKRMKAKTELSKFAIRLWDAYQYIASSQIDFLKLSDIFKEHALNLVMELSYLLDMIPPEKLREIFADLHRDDSIEITLEDGKTKSEVPSEIEIKKIKLEENTDSDESLERDELKEELIFEGVSNNSESFDFGDFEDEILKPISQLEALLKRILSSEVADDELDKFIAIVKKNAELSREIGFTIITEMHETLFTSLSFIKQKILVVDKSLVESMRACLIVIVAVVRGKEVDITNYLNKAENLGNYLKIS